jgi:hypothetical protein
MTQDRSSLIPMKTALFAFLLMLGLTLPRVGSAQTNVLAVANPVISVTPTNLNFGIIGVGRTKDLVVTIENVGGGTLAGSASAKDYFSVVSGGTYNLTNHQSQKVTIRYNPKTVGDFSQTVSFTGAGSLSVSAHGKSGIPPAAPQNLHIVNVTQ